MNSGAFVRKKETQKNRALAWGSLFCYSIFFFVANLRQMSASLDGFPGGVHLKPQNCSDGWDPTNPNGWLHSGEKPVRAEYGDEMRIYVFITVDPLDYADQPLGMLEEGVNLVNVDGKLCIRIPLSSCGQQYVQENTETVLALIAKGVLDECRNGVTGCASCGGPLTGPDAVDCAQCDQCMCWICIKCLVNLPKVNGKVDMDQVKNMVLSCNNHTIFDLTHL